ncbi:MAG: hypothetical protein LBE09_05755 [Christensenellaceae bacterium]|nr:hypothetical protein [Christensenellaceae bacterium]
MMSSINKRQCILVTLLIVFFLSITLVSAQFIINFSTAKTGNSNYVLHDKTEVTNFLVNHYGESYSCSEFKSSMILNRPNIKQSTMNDQFKYLTGMSVTGTCSEVATTQLIKSYGYASTYGYPSTYKHIMTIAKDKKYWTSAGTASNKIDSLVTDSFKFFGSKKRGNNDYLNIYSTITKYINQNKTLLFSCSDHTMHVVGYATWEVRYKQNVLGTNKYYRINEHFVVVNDGWYDASSNEKNRQFSYYPASLINIRDFVLTKVV